jgi:hypothetical protein
MADQQLQLILEIPEFILENASKCNSTTVEFDLSLPVNINGRQFKVLQAAIAIVHKDGDIYGPATKALLLTVSKEESHA